MGSYILNIVSLSLIFRFFCDLLFSVPRIFLSNLFFLSLLYARCFSLLSIFSLLCSFFPLFWHLSVISLLSSLWCVLTGIVCYYFQEFFIILYCVCVCVYVCVVVCVCVCVCVCIYIQTFSLGVQGLFSASVCV